jgi:hypothetical protein
MERRYRGEAVMDSSLTEEERLAAGASMLRDLIYTAWVDSGEPLADPYAGK